MGVDIYRALCMFLFIMFHFSDHGVIDLNTETSLTLSWLFLGTVRIFGALCNCAFAFISGYFLCSKTFNVKRIFKLWLQVWFYSVVLGIICHFNGTFPLRWTSMIKMIFPLTFYQYWYFSTYFIIALLSPFMNVMLKNLSRENHFKLAVILFTIFSFMPTFMRADWLINNIGIFITLYIIAAYIRFYDVKIFKNNNSYIKLAYFLIIFEAVSIILLKKFENNIFYTFYYFVWGMEKTPALILSIDLFMYFKDVKITSNKFISLINFISPSLFGVYLFHIGRLNTWLFHNVFNNSWTYNTPFMLLLQMTGSAVLIFITAILFDKICIKIFERPLMRNFDNWKWPKKINNYFIL